MKVPLITRKHCLVLLISSALLLLGAFLYLTHGNDVSFTAFPSPGGRIESVSDKSEGGNSWVEINHNDSLIIGKYVLKPGFTYPYAGIKLYLVESDTAGVDLSAYDSVHIGLSLNNLDAVRLFIKSYDSSMTDPSRPNTYKYLEREFRPGTEDVPQSFSLDRFSIPSWWMIQHDIDEHDKKISYELVNHIEILNGLSTSHAQDTVTAVLSSIRFTGKNKEVQTVIYILLSSIWLITIASCALYGIRTWMEGDMLRGFKSSALTAYRKVRLRSDDEEKRDRLVSFINEHYFDPDLTIDMLAHKSGINRKTASQLIRKYLDTNFKGYLNQLRLQEASRLLKETDKQITEIAVSVGYKNISHFSRTFKERFGASPKEYRSL